jgi:hypothetical protein
VRVTDWGQPANNDLLLVSQFSVTGALYTCRPDLVGFVNGLPLVVIELKKPGVPAHAALEKLNPTLPPEAITAAISVFRPISPADEMAFFSEIPGQTTGHECGHETRQESGALSSSGLCSSVNTDDEPDIYADI